MNVILVKFSKKENTDIANKAWLSRCFSDVFTCVKMSGERSPRKRGGGRSWILQSISNSFRWYALQNPSVKRSPLKNAPHRYTQPALLRGVAAAGSLNPAEPCSARYRQQDAIRSHGSLSCNHLSAYRHLAQNFSFPSSPHSKKGTAYAVPFAGGDEG